MESGKMTTAPSEAIPRGEMTGSLPI